MSLINSGWMKVVMSIEYKGVNSSTDKSSKTVALGATRKVKEDPKLGQILSSSISDFFLSLS